eukprot:CAMPEP_0172316804 /NCGR_PEP_ID=MMETSP1058-20130122/29559_1 /TAXON_ID=83371 /ORGANISM="Detonula confervacea, Strain CCMP 353" /LENGTH=532 /DNA_ID=CAMNT_0013031213 /DNA_START=239 /DNA_END=1834 /DNA_ORIENTATION=-
MKDAGDNNDTSRNIIPIRREASQRTKRIGSLLAAIATFLIFTWAIRTCIPPEVTTWHQQASVASLRSTIPPATQQQNTSDNNIPIPSNINQRRRRLTHMEQFAHPDDLKKLARKKMEYHDPRSTTTRKVMPLNGNTYKLNPLVKPDGYPWHRWTKPRDGTHALNTSKFVNILARLGNGEKLLGDVTPANYTVDGVPLTSDTIRLGGKARVYIIRDGTVYRPGGHTEMFVTLVQRAVDMAAALGEESPRMKILSEGEIPFIFDPIDYPWCGNDLVPIFRLNAIKSSSKCKHSWPAMSLSYFKDKANVQLAESPYQWDEMMQEWDTTYPWVRKIPKVVWRGRITGYTYRDGERPRQSLVSYARDYLDIMDIKPSTQRSKLPQDEFQKYKAILDIDGNAWSARLGKLLCYNSVVIKVEPEFVGYWEKEIEPWVHYIPVESDFSDLEKTVRYVMDPQNSEQMQQIVKNGQQFCRTKLTMEQYTVDILWTILSYAELLAGSPDFYDTWKRNKSAYVMSALDMKTWKPRVAANGGSRW